MAGISDTINGYINGTSTGSAISDAINGTGTGSAVADAINNSTGGSGLDKAFQGGVLLTTDKDKKGDNPNGNWEHIGALFDIIRDETSSVEADITDNWVETNFTYQDHIAIKPRIYRVSGLVGEVLYENISKVLEKLDDFKSKHPVFQKTTNVMKGMGALSSVVSNYTQAAINIATQIESSYRRYKNIYDNFTKANQIKGQRQTLLYEQLVKLMQNRISVKLTKLAFGEELETRSSYEKIYFIQSVSAHQGENAFISDIEVVIKEVRIATTKTTKVDSKKFAFPKSVQATETSQLGVSKGTVVPATPKEIQKWNELRAKGETTADWGKYKEKNLISRTFNSIKQKTNAYNQSIQIKPYSKKF